MNRGLFSFIWANSRKSQLVAIGVTILSLPLLYLSLELPKAIINQAIKGDDWPREILGISFGQIELLGALCSAFLVVFWLNAFFRHQVNLLKSGISVRLLSSLREQLMDHVLRFPLSHFKKVAPGEISTMIVAEVGPFGRFFGDALAVPIFEGARFVTILVFVFVQDFGLGMAASALIPAQAYLVPALQRRINQLTQNVIVEERGLSSRIAEVVDGVRDVRAQDGSAHVLDGFRERVRRLARFRMEISKRQSLIRLLNTMIGSVTPFLFYLIGGWLVIEGRLSFGGLIAALAAYHDLADPWDELLDYYREQAEARTKFDTVMGQFQSEHIGSNDSKRVMSSDQLVPGPLGGPIVADGLAYVNDEGIRALEDVSFEVEPGEHVLILSPKSRSREALVTLLARLDQPTGGGLSFGGVGTQDLPSQVSGSRIGLMDASPGFFNSTLGENLFLGLSRHDRADESDRDFLKGELSDTPLIRVPAFEQGWIDSESAGLRGSKSLADRTVDLLKAFELDEDVFALGMGVDSDCPVGSDFASAIVDARGDVRDRLRTLRLEDLIQPFSAERFNTYGTVAENILFGAARDEVAAAAHLTLNSDFRMLLKRHDLESKFVLVGLRCASTLTELLRGLTAGHPFFEQYSMVEEQDVPDLARTVQLAEKSGLRSLSDLQRNTLIRITLGMSPHRHRLGLVDAQFEAQVLELREAFRESQARRNADDFEPYDTSRFNTQLPILSNLVFGRIIFGRPKGMARVLEVVHEIVEARGLRDAIILRGLEAEAGVGGRRLSGAVRQKIGVVRNLLKRPDIAIVHDMMNTLGGDVRARLSKEMVREMQGRTLIWIDSIMPADIRFDREIRLDGSDRSGRSAAVDSIDTQAAGGLDPIDLEGNALSGETAVLRNVPLLAGLDWSTLKLIACTSERQEYERGDTIFRKGELGQDAFVLLSGEVEVVVDGAGGDEVLYRLGAGQMIGELAMLRDAKRSATVRSATDISALRLNREVFVETMRNDTGFAFEVARDLAGRLIDTTDRLGRTAPNSDDA